MFSTKYVQNIRLFTPASFDQAKVGELCCRQPLQWCWKIQELLESSHKAYSRLRTAKGSALSPADRTTNRSPKPSSKTSSGGTRLSAQLSTATRGFCVFANSFRRATRLR